MPVDRKFLIIGPYDGVLCYGNICYDIPIWPVTSVAWGKTVWVDEDYVQRRGNGANTLLIPWQPWARRCD